MELLALMLVGGIVGRSGRFLFHARRVGDGIIATMVGMLGAMISAGVAHTLDVRPNFGGLLLLSAVGAMAFFSIFRLTTVPAGEKRDIR